MHRDILASAFCLVEDSVSGCGLRCLRTWKARSCAQLSVYCLLLLTGIFVGCSGEDPDSPSASPTSSLSTQVDNKVSDIFGGTDGVDELRAASTVNAYLLPSSSFFEPNLSDYKTRTGPLAVPNDLKLKLSELLTRRESFEFDRETGCRPDYGLRFEFVGNAGTLDVLFCFGCSQLVVYRNGQHAGEALFHPSAAQFVTIAREAFPEDELIQSLGE